MEQNTKIEKPFCLDYEEARIEIFNAISQSSQAHNVPFYLLENILESALVQVREGKRNEIESAKRAYQQAQEQATV